VINGVAGFILGLVGYFTGLPGEIMGVLGNIGTWLVDSGKALIQGFIDGISGMVGAIGDAVGGVLGAVADFFPHSPAKRGPFSGSGYTTHSGKALAADFAKGMLSSQGSVESAASSIMTSASLTGKVGISSALLNSPGNKAAGGGVQMHVHPAQGMSEMTIANVAAHSLNYQLRKA
jgi:phage-related protein